MLNRYSLARGEAEKQADFVDLIDTNFTSCGFHYPVSAVVSATESYVAGWDLRRYTPDPAGDPALREAVAAYFRDGGVAADSQGVVITASASESYSHIFASRCLAGDRVMLPRPGYPLFEDIAERHGLSVDYYDQRRSEGWTIDPEQIARMAGPRTAAIVLISPNNPTGSIVSESTITEIGAVCERHGMFLVVDEVFSEIVFPSAPFSGETTDMSSDQARRRARLPRPASLLPNQLVYTINGVSKLFAAPDLKVSWVLVTGPASLRAQAIENLQVHNDLFLSSSALSQAIAVQMFRGGLAFTREMTAEIRRRRDVVLGEIAGIEGVAAIPPAGGIHLPVAFSSDVLPAGHDDEDVAVGLLQSCHVATHPGYLYGIDSPVSIVLSFLSPSDRLRDGLGRIRTYLRTRSR